MESSEYENAHHAKLAAPRQIPVERFAFPITLAAVALGVFVMAFLFLGPLGSEGAAERVRVLLAPARPDGADPDGGIERLDARSGRVDYHLLDERLRGLMEDPAMVGLAVAVVENGEIVFARGYGETLHGSGEPVTIDTPFRWASLSKGVAATMVAMLARDGSVDLDAPVSRYAPSLRLPASGQMRATVRDLLSHRLGIERNSFDARLEADEDPESLRMRMGSLPSVCPPGDCHRYQNIAFDSASEIVEGITGESYEAAVQTRLLRPLGLDQATVSRRGLVESPGWAHSHGRAGNEIAVVEPYYRIPAAGGMNGSIRDLARWMQAQMGSAPEVLPPSLLTLVHRPVVDTERENRRNARFAGRLGHARYALGWRVYDYAGHEVIAHRGAVRGYRALIMFDPARRAGVVALWNSETGRPFAIPMDVFDRLYRLPDADWIGAGAAPPGETAASPPARPSPAMIEGRRRPGGGEAAP